MPLMKLCVCCIYRYAITLIAMYNCGDLLGRCIPLIKGLMLKSRPGLIVLTLIRFGLIPAFYFTAKYGTQGWMLFLCIALGISNGYITVCVFVEAPTGYTVSSCQILSSDVIFLRR